MKMAADKMAKAMGDGLHKTFKIQNTISTTSMVLFDAQGCLRRFDTVEEILKEFFTVRMERYRIRKAYLQVSD